MSRPRTIPDAAVLEAAAKAISRVGPGNITLADIAEDAGLSPATLLQRFGSKRGLLLAVATAGTESIEACFDAVRAANPSPLEGLLAAATEMPRHVNTPEEMANHLAFLQIDLSDPDFYRLMRRSSEKILAGYEALITDAVRKGELRPCDPARLARAVAAVTGGSLIAWAVHREGRAEEWVRDDLATLIEPHRRAARARKVRATGRRSAATGARASKAGTRSRPTRRR